MSGPPPAQESGPSAAAATGSTAPGAPRPVERSRRDSFQRRHEPFVPLLLLTLAGVSWPAFQCYQLIKEQQTMATVLANQTKPFEEAGKLRSSLEAIARETALLASKGNANAQLIVDELGRRGVTINPNAAPSTPPQSAN